MKIEISLQGQIFTADAEIIRGTTWVHFNGRTFVYEPETQKNKGRKRSGNAASGTVLAPMPGKVIKILKSVGDKARIGDVILVMEAMKMEYTLKSEIDGVVKHIDCKISEQVALGKKLAFIEGGQS